LRKRATALGFAHRLRLDSHRRPIVEGFNLHKIALVGCSHERKRSHEALTNAHLRPPRIDRGCDKGAMRQRADELLVHDHRHLRGDRDPVSTKNKYQCLPGRRDGAGKIPLGVRRSRQNQTTREGEREGAGHRTTYAQLIHRRVSILLFLRLLRRAAEYRT